MCPGSKPIQPGLQVRTLTCQLDASLQDLYECPYLLLNLSRNNTTSAPETVFLDRYSLIRHLRAWMH